MGLGHYLEKFWGTYVLDIFENPYGAPDPRRPNPPPSNKKRNSTKIPKTPIIPKSKGSFLKRKNALSLKVNARSPKVNVKYF